MKGLEPPTPFLVREADAQGPADEDLAAVEAARRKLADCDGRLAKHRAALERPVGDQSVTNPVQESSPIAKVGPAIAPEFRGDRLG